MHKDLHKNLGGYLQYLKAYLYDLTIWKQISLLQFMSHVQKEFFEISRTLKKQRLQ